MSFTPLSCLNHRKPQGHVASHKLDVSVYSWRFWPDMLATTGQSWWFFLVLSRRGKGNILSSFFFQSTTYEIYPKTRLRIFATDTSAAWQPAGRCPDVRRHVQRVSRHCIDQAVIPTTCATRC